MATKIDTTHTRYHNNSSNDWTQSNQKLHETFAVLLDDDFQRRDVVLEVQAWNAMRTFAVIYFQ